jgi:flagellar protein FliS
MGKRQQLMAGYSTALRGDPEATYRQIDLVGRTGEADGPALVQLLYELKAEKITRATAILFALEAGLDFDKGGEVSHTLARLYRGARNAIIDASVGSEPQPVLEVASNLEEIAQAWAQARRA